MAKNRIREPSTWAGLGVMLLGLDQLLDVNEAADLGNDIVQVATSGAELPIILTAILTSLFSIIMPDKSKKGTRRKK